MGLCKCPKKKVTNLFCFEHRVNVCEHCLVANHPRCIVQSYLQWLQDSDYDPTCQLCRVDLSTEDSGECVRLVCYDVFHWKCLDKYARSFPANTAPAGYTCPSCKSCIFPAPNVASPVAETLRKVLIQVNWARAGLGLPLIDEPEQTESNETNHGQEKAWQNNPNIPQNSAMIHAGGPIEKPNTTDYSQYGLNQWGQTNAQQSVVSIDDSTPYARGTDKLDFNPRKLFDSTREDQSLLNMSAHDHDDDKYKRRPALQWLSRWFNSRVSKHQRRDPNASKKRIAVIVVLGILGFLTMVVIFMRLGRASADNDPFLDPMANPNIRVESN